MSRSGDVQECSMTGRWPAGVARDAVYPVRTLLGFRFWDTSLKDVARELVRSAQAGESRQVFFVNAHCVNVAARDPGYRRLLEEQPWLLADGAGMALAGRIAGVSVENNVNGTDLFPELCAEAAREGVPIALLGAAPGVAERCKERMRAAYPDLKVAYTGHGYLSPAEDRAVVDALNASGARVVFVAMGVPRQERWIAAHRHRLHAPVLLGVGALFDFYSGDMPRAPAWLRALRLEWLFRLALEPRRMFSRYVIGNPAFVWRALRYRLSGGAS